MKSDASTHAPSPLVCTVQETAEETNTNELANTPACVNPGGEDTAKRQRGHLRSISRSERLEDTPRESGNDLATHDHFEAVGKEEEEDGAAEPDESPEQGALVTVALGKDTVGLRLAHIVCTSTHDCAHDAGNSSGVADTRHPAGRDLPVILALVVDVVGAEALAEARVGVWESCQPLVTEWQPFCHLQKLPSKVKS